MSPLLYYTPGALPASSPQAAKVLQRYQLVQLRHAGSHSGGLHAQDVRREAGVAAAIVTPGECQLHTLAALREACPTVFLIARCCFGGIKPWSCACPTIHPCDCCTAKQPCRTTSGHHLLHDNGLDTCANVTPVPNNKRLHSWCSVKSAWLHVCQRHVLPGSHPVLGSSHVFQAHLQHCPAGTQTQQKTRACAGMHSPLAPTW